MVHAIGLGHLETRALSAFMPRLSQALLRLALALQTIATGGFGQDARGANT